MTRSFAGRLLLRLSDAVYFHRRWFFYPQAILVVASLFYTVRYLEFRTNRRDLVGGDKLYHRIYQEFRAEFPGQDDLVVVVESDHMEKNRQFVERLGAKLDRETNTFTGVFYKGDLTMMGPKALLFMPDESLLELSRTLHEYLPFLQKFTQATNLVSLINLVNTQFRTARPEPNAENQALLKALPALERIINEAAESLQRPGDPPSPGIEALFEGGDKSRQRTYLTFANHRIYLLTAQALNEPSNARAVDRLRELIEETRQEVPGLNVGLTGESVLEYDEMTQSQKDSTLATVVSLLGVALLFIYGYHETGRPLKATACLLVGIIYTMGFTTLTVGHLNILTIAFVPILIGLAIDFGVHLITRYEEELRHGRTEKVALEKAMVNTGLGIFTGAFTTAGAFFAMTATNFKGVQEMGIICGGGLLVCLVPMVTLLPVLLLRGRQNLLDHELVEELDRRDHLEVDRRARLENVWLSRPRLTILITCALSVGAAALAPKVQFDYNLLNMQSAGLPAVIYQDKLIKSSTKSVLFGAVVADSAVAATNLLSQLTNLPVVASVDSMVSYLTEDQTRKLETVRLIKETLSRLHFTPIDLSPVDRRDLIQAIFSLHGYAGLAAEAVKSEDPALRKALESLRESISRLSRQLLTGDRAATVKKLATFQQALFSDVQHTFQSMQNQDASGPMRAEDMPAFLRKRFIGVTGKHLLQVYPKTNVWERAAQREFIQQLRMLDEKTTGTPVQLYEYTTLLKRSYEEAAGYSVLAIAVLIFVHFRRISCVALALIPVLVGFLWMVGFMALFGLAFNPANIMTLPLTVGIGVTNGIHILNRFAEEQHPSILARSTGKAVMVSALTTVFGFGSLILAEHRGIRSLGCVMSIGVMTCMIVALTFLPAILNLLSERGWTIKKPSATMHGRHWVGRNRGETSSLPTR